MTRRSFTLVWALLAATGCGGPQLLVDLSPTPLIPNGGSAQAGQVEGPTAIPITGEGAIVEVPPPAPEIGDGSPAPDPGASPIEAEASRLALGGATNGDDGEDAEDALAPDRDAVDDAPGEVAAEPAREAPAIEAAPSSAAPVVPRTRSVVGPGYAFDIPAAWENLDPGGLGSVLISSAYRSMAPRGGFLTNVIVSAEPYAGDSSAYAKASVPSLLDGGASLRASETSSVAGHPALDVEAWWVNLTGAPYVTLQRYVVVGDVGLVVTCAAAASDFEEERDTCLDIFDSFRFE